MDHLYAPDRQEIVDVAERATLANPHPDAKGWLLDKVRQPPGDWDSRTFHSVPGLVWTISSDTCMTGRPSAPKNIAYDDLGREFVFRQPANEFELAGVMSADSEEVFACYRFDGLERCTVQAVDAWFEDHTLIIGWLRHSLTTVDDGETRDSLSVANEYLTSDALRDYVAAFKELLLARGVSAPGYTRPR